MTPRGTIRLRPILFRNPQTTSATLIEGNLEFEDEPHRYSCKLASMDRTPERTTGDNALCG